MSLPNSRMLPCWYIAGLERAWGIDSFAIAVREDRIREARQAVSFFLQAQQFVACPKLVLKLPARDWNNCMLVQTSPSKTLLTQTCRLSLRTQKLARVP
jgi:hypothetical protein